MLSFLTKPFTRSQTTSQNPLVTDDGATLTEFLIPEHPHDGFCVKQTFFREKYLKLKADGREAVITPPYHWHVNQIEYFEVEKGSMILTVDDKNQIVTPKDGKLVIKPGVYHTFHFNPDSTEDLIVRIWAEPEDGATEQFFRNLFSYLDDCKKNKKAPNLFQLLLILHSSETYLVLPKVPKFIGKFVSRWVLGYVGGKMIGEKILGFKESYPEYTTPNPVGGDRTSKNKKTK